MTRVVVADTGPLIGLARVDKLDLVRSLYERVEVPAAVRDEFGIDSGRPGANVLSVALMQRWINVQWSQDLVVEPELAGLVDPGEAQAIALAETRAARFLLIDDAKGRKLARRRGIPVVGVAGVLLAAKSRGILVSVAPVLRDLSSVGEAASVLETGVGASSASPVDHAIRHEHRPRAD